MWHVACRTGAVDHESMAIGGRARLKTTVRLFAAATLAAALACDGKPQPRPSSGSARGVDTSARGVDTSAQRSQPGRKRMSEAGLARIREHEAFKIGRASCRERV